MSSKEPNSNDFMKRVIAGGIGVFTLAVYIICVCFKSDNKNEEKKQEQKEEKVEEKKEQKIEEEKNNINNDNNKNIAEKKEVEKTEE